MLFQNRSTDFNCCETFLTEVKAGEYRISLSLGIEYDKRTTISWIPNSPHLSSIFCSILAWPYPSSITNPLFGSAQFPSVQSCLLAFVAASPYVQLTDLPPFFPSVETELSIQPFSTRYQFGTKILRFYVSLQISSTSVPICLFSTIPSTFYFNWLLQRFLTPCGTAVLLFF